MSAYSALSHLAAEWRTAREEARTRRAIELLPKEIQKDIGWPDTPLNPPRGPSPRPRLNATLAGDIFAASVRNHVNIAPSSPCVDAYDLCRRVCRSRGQASVKIDKRPHRILGGRTHSEQIFSALPHGRGKDLSCCAE